MKVSRHWLSKFFDQELPPAQKLAEALTFHAFEIDGIESSAGTEVLDVKVTPNRGHDCLSHRGIASELSAILNVPLAHDPFAEVPALVPQTNAVAVTIHDAELCPRYIAGRMAGVKVGPSPQWLVENLQALGQRSINNVVDATNFVMFNLGQPLHAFDAAQLSKKSGTYKIGVRRALPDESITALDGKAYALSPRMLLIVDGDLNRPIGIAGVKGGAPAAITEATSDIVIESANFEGASVRKTAAALKLRTDASARFEQGLSPELAAWGMLSAVKLIQELAGGTLEGFVDHYPAPQKIEPVSVTVAQVRQILGAAFSDADVSLAFERLGLPYKVENGAYTVTPPPWRLDLAIAEDLIEEVARIAGYDRLPAKALPPLGGKPALNENFFRAEAAREDLRLKGYSEVFTSVFSAEGERAVANKIGGDKPFLRKSLLPGLTEALARNAQNKDLLGLKEVKLFEIGTVWQGGKETAMVGTAGEKEAPKEMALSEAGKAPDQWAQYPAFVPPPAQFKAFSRFPYVVRDVAMWVPGGTGEAAVEDTLMKEAGELAVAVRLFDRFEKAGKVSLAYRIIFQSFERTLTEKEVNEIMEKVHAALRAQGYEIR